MSYIVIGKVKNENCRKFEFHILLNNIKLWKIIMKGISRSEMNQLMTIPEIQQIIAAKFVELRLVFKHRLKEKEVPETDDWEEHESNIIRFPLRGKRFPVKDQKSTASISSNKEETDRNLPTTVKIVDASEHRYIPEDEQIKIFMNYFKNHQGLRKEILDEFFLRILPYSNLMVK